MNSVDRDELVDVLIEVLPEVLKDAEIQRRIVSICRESGDFKVVPNQWGGYDTD